MKRFTVNKVTDLHFGRHIGKNFDDLGVPFVVVYGSNETGKTTLAEFLTWAIGGPWRAAAANSGIFQVTGKELVHGRLVADLDNTAVDIDAKFRILDKGVPNDLRGGTFGSQALDADSIGRILSGLTPMDYQLIYRLYGGSLGDIGSAGAFSDLFTSFAMGSTSGTGNPRASLSSLQQRLGGLEKPLKDLRKAQKAVEGSIKEASKAPDDIARTESEITELTQTIDALSLQRDALAGERLLVKRALDGLVHIQVLNQAQDAVSQLGELAENWQQVADAVDAIDQAVQKCDSLARSEGEKKERAQLSVNSCGMSEDLLRDRTFTPPERQHLESLVRDLVDAKDAEKRLVDEKQSLENQTDSAKSAASVRQAELSLSAEQIAFLDSNDVTSLTERAGRWEESIVTLISKQETLASEKVRVKQSKDAYESGGQEKTKSLPRAAIAAGFAAVSLLAIWNSAAAIIAGVVLAALSFVLTGKSPSGSKGVKDSSPDNSGIDAIERGVAEAEVTAEHHREYLHDAAGPLASLLTHPDMARGVIQSLGELSKMRQDLRNLMQAIERVERQITDAQVKVKDAEDLVTEALDVRSIPFAFANKEFSVWLALYETAVADVAAYEVVRAALQEARETYFSLVRAIENEIVDLDSSVVLARVQQAAKTLGDIRSAQGALRDAKLKVNAAQMDSDEIVSLLQTYSNEAALESRHDSLNDEIDAVNESRDEAITSRTSLQGEVDRKSGVEVLPGLHLEKGQIEDKIEAIEHQQKLLASATSILSDVIERYENENQDPVVLSASALVSKVVPDWGTIRFSRSDDGKGTPILERNSSDGRLNDKLLSDGGRALMYLALRIAFAQKDAERRGIALPLICDDPLVHFDDERSESAIKLLAEVSKVHQVLLFTCERRTRDIAESLGARVLEI